MAEDDINMQIDDTSSSAATVDSADLEAYLDQVIEMAAAEAPEEPMIGQSMITFLILFFSSSTLFPFCLVLLSSSNSYSSPSCVS